MCALVSLCHEAGGSSAVDDVLEDAVEVRFDQTFADAVDLRNIALRSRSPRRSSVPAGRSRHSACGVSDGLHAGRVCKPAVRGRCL